MSGAANPTLVPLAAITRDHRPAKIGADKLVPPTCDVPPFTMIRAPEFGLPSNATSATPRVVPETNPFCQLGFGSNVLWLPPVAPLESFHTTSLFQVVLDASRRVPDMAIPNWEAAGQLGVMPPFP